MKRKAQKAKPTVAMVGAGSLASFLAPALVDVGYRMTEIIARPRRQSLKGARCLARSVGARAVTPRTAELDASVLWFAVPDREIPLAAEQMAKRLRSSKVCFAFHSSGALGSRELDALRAAGVAVASVHPLMTFVPGARPSLAGVPFALEGDAAAVRMARRVVRDLGGESFSLHARNKAAYHAWATMTSPLLVAYLVTLEKAARLAGMGRENARRMSLPIIHQTLANYGRLAPGGAFSGPFLRGDAETIAKHLALLKASPGTRDVYVALARVALAELPTKSREKVRRLLKARGARKAA